MACDTVSKPIEENKTVINNENEIEDNNKKENKMSSSLVLRKAPEFKMDAYDSKSWHYVEVKSDDYKGKWHVVCFYPADFTFVCPTEITAMNAKYDEFQKLGVVIWVQFMGHKSSNLNFISSIYTII